MRGYRGINPSQTRNALQEVDLFLRDVAMELSLNQPAADETASSSIKNAQYIVLALDGALNKERKLVANSPLVLTDFGPNANLELDLSAAALYGPPAFTLTTANAEGSAATAVRTDASLAIFDATVPSDLASAAATGSAAFAARRDHVHVFPSTLRSTAATAGDTLALTSNGTDLTLTPSRASADLVFNDQAAAEILRLVDSSEARRGIKVTSRALITDNSAAPIGDAVVEMVAKRSTSHSTVYTGLRIAPTLDNSLEGSAFQSGIYAVNFATGFDPDAGSSGTITSMFGHAVNMSGTVGGAALLGNILTLAAFRSSINITIPAASNQWTEVIGILSENCTVGGTAPARSYGLKCTSAGNGTIAMTASFGGGMVQVATTQKLGLGRAQTVLPTNSLRAKTSTGSIVVMELNSADEYEWSTAGFYPATNGGADLGIDNFAWGALRLKDTAAAFELTIQASNIGADRTLTFDLDGNYTITLGGNVTFPSGSAYTPTNVTTDRSYDANATTTDELADVLGTLIGDLQTAGVIP